MSDLADINTLLKRAYLRGVGLRLTAAQVRELCAPTDHHGRLIPVMADIDFSKTKLDDEAPRPREPRPTQQRKRS